MKRFLVAGLFSLLTGAAMAQTKPAQTTPPTVVSAIEGVSGKRFVADTVYAALSDDDKTLLGQQAVANWSLAQESGGMTFHNLVVGTRSYQLLITKSPKAEFPTAMLLRYADPKAKPEPIARGTLRPRPAEKAN